MHEKCPHYYRITPTEDLNHWLATCLRTARWAQHVDAILLNILYGQVCRYIVRLPFKGISEPDMVRDIDKAITQLQDLRAALVPLPPEAI